MQNLVTVSPTMYAHVGGLKFFLGRYPPDPPAVAYLGFHKGGPPTHPPFPFRPLPLPPLSLPSPPFPLEVGPLKSS